MKILFATDGSGAARAALDFLLAFPLPTNSEITLVSVIEKDKLANPNAEGLNAEQRNALHEVEKAVTRSWDNMLNEEAKRVRDAGWAGAKLIRSGHPADEIVRTAAEIKADMVVVGSHGLTGIRRYLLGSVSSSVLEYAHCSVMIVKGIQERRAKDERLHILLAYDDSESSKCAVDFCADLPLGDQVEITVVSVLPLVTLYRQDIKQRLSWFWHQKKQAAKMALERVTKEIEWATPNVDFELRESGDVTEEILNSANKLDSDLIVVAHKGRGAIERFLLGSTTGRVARHASCSVLAVRA